MSANAQTTTVEYIHTDALGTPVAVTDAAGTVIERSEYEPFGQLVNRPLTDGPGFAGHVQDAATGLTYMQQRYYDPLIGRFLSVDPVTAYSMPGGNFNRYWYVNNNPYRFFDPDGRLADEPRPKQPRSPEEPEPSEPPEPPPPPKGCGVMRDCYYAGDRWYTPTNGGKPISVTAVQSTQDKYALSILLGESVDKVQVLVNSPKSKLYGAVATTGENVIFVAGSADSFANDPRLMLEEYYHVVKQWNKGMSTIDYLWEHYTNGNGYKGSKYEMEAKKFAEDNLQMFIYMRTP